MEDACGRTTAAVTSCWGRFGVAVLWRRLIRRMSWPRRRYRTYVLGAGGLNYDPLSYSQNFDDDGKVCECEPGFLASRPGRRSASLRHEEAWGDGGKGKPKSLAAAFLAFARTSGGGEDMGYMYNFNSDLRVCTHVPIPTRLLEVCYHHKTKATKALFSFFPKPKIFIEYLNYETLNINKTKTNYTIYL
ncbi:hypothetical protein BDA96_04G308800 [Sorghum bicolor]|uniref:Uncharacterized protein n=1 Tax=Sorghum bicolor TaxID=4558 RepID=A0A921UME5_SORBI|nr:hypothetical protein BDA96_04G308800 [Sorghum bicolor]